MVETAQVGRLTYTDETGAFSLVFLSSVFPGECVACCKGSSLFLGLKGERFNGKYIRVNNSSSSSSSSSVAEGSKGT